MQNEAGAVIERYRIDVDGSRDGRYVTRFVSPRVVPIDPLTARMAMQSGTYYKLSRSC